MEIDRFHCFKLVCPILQSQLFSEKATKESHAARGFPPVPVARANRPSGGAPAEGGVEAQGEAAVGAGQGGSGVGVGGDHHALLWMWGLIKSSLIHGTMGDDMSHYMGTVTHGHLGHRNLHQHPCTNVR